MTKPYIIITNGATGSGKTSLIDKTIKHYNLDSTYEKVLIDILIENNSHYKESVNKIVLNECNKLVLCDKLSNKLTEPPDEVIKSFEKAYFETRGTTNSDDNYCVDENEEKINCSDKSFQLFNEHLKSGKNIVWETQILYDIPWFKGFVANATDTPYDIYYAVTILGVDDLVNRNKSRASIDMSNYIEDTNNPAPRLPNVSKDAFIEMNKKIADNLIPLIKEPNKHDMTVCVFDNTTYNTGIIYDSKNIGNIEVKNVIDNILKIMQTDEIYKVGGNNNKTSIILTLLGVLFLI